MMTTYTTFEKAALLTGYSMRQFRRLVKAEAVPVMHMGRKVFLLTADVLEFQRKHERLPRIYSGPRKVNP